MSNIQELSPQDDFNELVNNSDIPVLVDFWAEWCRPCKNLLPTLEEIADEKAGQVRIVKANIDEVGDLAHEHQVMSIPNLILFDKGQKVDQLIGGQSKEQIEAVLAPFI